MNRLLQGFFHKISVSLRSIIHSYMKETENFNIFHGFKISVSLRSIIHSYYYKDVLYNFLTSLFPSPYGVSFILIQMLYFWLVDNGYINFRLLTEYHSFLFFSHTTSKHRNLFLKFPSPYGVSFILIISYSCIHKSS